MSTSPEGATGNVVRAAEFVTRGAIIDAGSSSRVAFGVRLELLESAMRAAAKRRDRIQSTGPFALKIESFEGRDTFLRCGNDQQDFLYCAVVLSEDGRLTIVDNGYRSMEELSEAWTELAGPVEMATLKTRKKNHPRP